MPPGQEWHESVEKYCQKLTNLMEVYKQAEMRWGYRNIKYAQLWSHAVHSPRE